MARCATRTSRDAVPPWGSLHAHARTSAAKQRSHHVGRGRGREVGTGHTAWRHPPGEESPSYGLSGAKTKLRRTLRRLARRHKGLCIGRHLNGRPRRAHRKSRADGIWHIPAGVRWRGNRCYRQTARSASAPHWSYSGPGAPGRGHYAIAQRHGGTNHCRRAARRSGSASCVRQERRPRHQPHAHANAVPHVAKADGSALGRTGHRRGARSHGPQGAMLNGGNLARHGGCHDCRGHRRKAGVLCPLCMGLRSMRSIRPASHIRPLGESWRHARVRCPLV